jgi:uncharacterized membrane protein YdbT with pleckstrin-like domain
MKPIRHANLDLFEHDPDERLIGEVPRHPIGLVLIALNGLFLLIVLFVIGFFFVRYQEDVQTQAGLTDTFDAESVIIGLLAILAALIVIGTLVALYVYRGNYIVLTDQKLVLINTRSIFARRVSQLSIGDVQDVTIDQATLLSRIFHYGTINIETAGEQAHFMFPYTPQPHQTGKAIVDAHEKNLQLYGN